jgi:hypothetical protein
VSEPVCPRAGKLFRGCRFEGRYDTPLLSRFDETFGMFTRMTTEPVPGEPTKVRIVQPEPPKKTYVRDVCVTCGRTIERQGDAA